MTKAQKYMDMAYKFYIRNNWPQAIEYYSKAADIDPGLIDSWLNRGAIYCDAYKDYNCALECFNKALQIDPLDTCALSNKGISLCHLKQYDQSLTCLNRALDLDPNFNEIVGIINWVKDCQKKHLELRLKPYLIDIWGPFATKEQIRIPDVFTACDNRMLVFAYSAQQANDIAYYACNKFYNSDGDGIKLMSNYQEIELVPDKYLVVHSWDEAMTFPPDALKSIEGISNKIEIEYQQMDQNIYFVELYKASSVKLPTTEDITINKQPISEIFVLSNNAQAANMMALKWAEDTEAVNGEDATYAIVHDVENSIGLWNPVFK